MLTDPGTGSGIITAICAVMAAFGAIATAAFAFLRGRNTDDATALLRERERNDHLSATNAALVAQVAGANATITIMTERNRILERELADAKARSSKRRTDP